jgi:hypothetical protein
MTKTRNYLFDFGIAGFAGLISLIIFIRESGWSELNSNAPLMYFGDPIYYANLVRNAQSGSVLLGKNLGAPNGQEYGLTAYGFEWIQSHFIALFAEPSMGPWAALNRYALYSFFATAFCSYLILRWMKISHLIALFGSVAFTLIPAHQVYSPGLGNMSALVVGVGVAWKITSGSRLNNLFFDISENRTLIRNVPVANAFILFLVCLFQLTAALYYVIFIALLVGSILIFKLLRGDGLRSLGLGITFLVFQMITLLLALAPILFGRLSQSLPFSEPTTGDRRPFAAYANGGDLFAVFAPHTASSLFYRSIIKIPGVQNFFQEYYFTSSKQGYEYTIYPTGMIFVAILILCTVVIIMRKGSSLIIQLTPFFLLIGLTLGWYIRGGFGTFFSFLFPFIRGYARFSAILIFLGIALLGFMITQFRQRNLRVIGIVLLLITLLDNISSIPKINQSVTKSEQKTVGADELPGANTVAEGITFRTLGYLGTLELNRNAENLLEGDCSVAVLPLVSFQVDFKIGITSYYTLELIKPGVEPSNLKWSSGGITGTPNNSFSDRNLASYQSGDYTGLLDDIEGQGFCGVLVFRGLQNAFYEAGPENGSNYGSSEALVSKLIARFEQPCYSDLDSAVDLFCIRKKT